MVKQAVKIMNIITLVALAAIVVQVFESRIWPWGRARPWTDRVQFSAIDKDNDSLRIKYGRVKKIFELVEGDQPLMKGPESVVFGNDGTMYVMNEEGFLICLSGFQEKNDGVTIAAKTKMIANLGPGRPLGGSFSPDGALYVADAHLGLTRLSNLTDGSKVELVASRVFDQGKWSQIAYANDVAVGPKTGNVYFTDSSEIAPERIGTVSWDTMYAAKMDYIRGGKTGRLLQYNPQTNEVKVLARGYHYSNGIAVDKDERWVVFAETFSPRIHKYDLNTGIVAPVVDGGMTGYPDGVACAWKGTTAVQSESCFAVMPNPESPIMALVRRIPHPIDMLLRSLVMGLPKALVPAAKPYGGLLEFDPDDGSTTLIQDPYGKDVKMLTGVAVFDNRLYMGSLYNDHITVYQL